VTRRLVITADDLGRDARTTGTILDLAVRGNVTATTLIPVTDAADVAAHAAAELGLVPRLHATLTSESDLPPWRSLSGRATFPHGRLPSDHDDLARTATDGDVAAELAAQLGWMRARGVPPGGVDSHAGALYGLNGRAWLLPTLRWCAAEGLALRLPRDLVPYPGTVGEELARAHRDAVALADALGVALPSAMITNDRGASELGSYAVLRAQMIALLDELPEGTSELVLHPADGLDGEVGVVRSWEARLLRDPAWQDALDAARIDPVPDWWSSTHW
jgi:chitin disaccharide deacetylase